MKLSVIICTYNNYEMLESCLINIDRLCYNKMHEVIVIDNSSDNISQQQFVETVLPKFLVKYIESSPPSLSRARNVGYTKAKGDIVAYIDDDAFPQSGWDKAILECFENVEVGIAGGPVHPLWESHQPHWLPKEFIGVYSVVELGETARIMAYNEMLVGANMAFRKKILIDSCGFNEKLGRVGTNLLSNEETELISKLREQWQCYYHPKALVQHFIKQKRCTQQWVLSRMAWQGLSDLQASASLFEWKKAVCNELENETLKSTSQEFFKSATNAVEMTERLQFARFMGELLFDNSAKEHFSCWDSIARGDIVFPELLYKAQVLFVEFSSHSYLYSSYSSGKRTALIKRDVSCWENHHEYIRNILAVFDFAKQHSFQHIVFMTLSPMFDLSSVDIDVLSQCANLQLVGFLHQGNFETSRCTLADVEKYFAKFFVFHDIQKNAIVNQYPQLSNKIVSVPHPFVHLKSYYEKNGVQRKNINAKITLGFLGGFRDGKGFLECVKMITKLPLKIRESIHCLFAGGVQDDIAQIEISSLLNSVRVSNECHIKQRGKHPNDFKGVTDVEYTNSLLRTDIILYPYYGPQANAFSGNFSDALASGCVAMANQGCLMADIIEKEELGFTFSLENQESFEKGLVSAIDAVRRHIFHEKQCMYISKYDLLNVNIELFNVITGMNFKL